MVQKVLAANPRNGSVRNRLVKAILQHHREWQVFRANLRALCATDEKARAARLIQRERQISFLETQARSVGRTQVDRAQIWYILLAFEAICDSIADGDAADLSVPESGLIAILEPLLAPVTG